MKAWVAVTDNDWFRFLALLSDVDEVNFWQPSVSGAFRALSPGEPFLFKLHRPENFIVGGGFFAHFSVLPVSLAWDAFGERNGAATIVDMRERIEQYRRSANPTEDYMVGCIILERPFFFDRAEWIPAPEDFHPNIVRGKGYDLAEFVGRRMWEEVQLRLAARSELEEVAATSELALVRRRLGQGAFRVLVTDTYERRCAVTQEKVLPVLEAAHVKPVAAGGVHEIDNGLLLRSDVHTLFDRGYVTVTPDHRFQVSRRLRDEFSNGEYYLQFSGSEVWMPSVERDRPRREFLEWHSDTVFLAS